MSPSEWAASVAGPLICPSHASATANTAACLLKALYLAMRGSSVAAGEFLPAEGLGFRV